MTLGTWMNVRLRHNASIVVDGVELLAPVVVEEPEIERLQHRVEYLTRYNRLLEDRWRADQHTIWRLQDDLRQVRTGLRLALRRCR